MVLYHLVSMTDIVPFQPKTTLFLIGVSNMAVIALSAFGFLVQILWDLIHPLFKKLQRKYYHRKFENKKK